MMQTLPKSPLCASFARSFSFGIFFIVFILPYFRMYITSNSG
jgi:hypothetical protein